MNRYRFVLAIGAALAMAVVGGGAAAADSAGVCVVAQVSAPIVLPDGSEHPAGALKLCGGPAFSPVTVFQKTYVGGRVVGYFMSRSRQAEAEPGGPPLITFIKAEGGRLALAGYALPSGRRTTAYIFEDVWRDVASRRPSIPQDATPTASATVVVAATTLR